MKDQTAQYPEVKAQNTEEAGFSVEKEPSSDSPSEEPEVIRREVIKLMENGKAYVDAEVLMETVFDHYDRDADAAILPRKVIEAMFRKGLRVSEDDFFLFDAGIANDGDVTTEELEEEIEHLQYFLERLVSQNTSSEEEVDEIMKDFDYGELRLVIPLANANLVFKVEWLKDKEEDC